MVNIIAGVVVVENEDKLGYRDGMEDDTKNVVEGTEGNKKGVDDVESVKASLR